MRNRLTHRSRYFRTPILQSALVLALTLALTACDSPTDPTPVNGLTLTASVTPTTIAAGSEGRVTATLRNVSRSARTINLSFGCDSLIRLVRSPGNEPVPTNTSCAQVVVPVNLAPGQEYTQTLHVGSGAVTQPGTVLQAGEYSAIADGEHSDVPELRSLPVRFTVQ